MCASSRENGQCFHPVTHGLWSWTPREPYKTRTPSPQKYTARGHGGDARSWSIRVLRNTAREARHSTEAGTRGGGKWAPLFRIARPPRLNRSLRASKDLTSLAFGNSDSSLGLLRLRWSGRSRRTERAPYRGVHGVIRTCTPRRYTQTRPDW